ncbi:MAG: hypothetical protein ACRD0Q_04285 [Acidimicrobiales bacterium]
MAQPDFVTVPLADKPRKGEPMPPPRRWTATRPGDLTGRQPTGSMLGSPGPDQGYALRLARRFSNVLQLAVGEHDDDVVAGCLGVALRRASLFGRAPVIHDLEVAFTMWGYLGDAPDDLIAYRRPLFAGASHHYWDQRRIADSVLAASLWLSPAEVRDRLLKDWRSLLGA